MRIFPIRHHSPAAARHLERLIHATRPAAVLIEGPIDATPLIPLLLEPDTAPPVAIYAYRAGEQVRSTFYPLCDYSPELVALRAGQAVGAQLSFCDLPAGSMLDDLDGAATPDAAVAPDPASTEPQPSAPAGELLAPAGGGWEGGESTPTDPHHVLAEAAGFENFEAFWEAAFEQEAAQGTPEQFAAAIALYGHQLRALDHRRDHAPDERRERHMAAVARRLVREGVDPARLLLVCGAYHVDGVARFYARETGEAEAPGGAPAETVLIPFSFPRLAEQTGYGAGNRAPWYYQQVWSHGGDYAAATRHALLAVMRRLRESGHLASLAQAIDAESLARTLTGLREKRQPGADELIDAAVACFGGGEAGLVREALREVLIGDAVGRLSSRVGRTPLQTAFYTAVQQVGLPLRDVPREVLVHLPDPREREQSILLHRLVVAAIPFARQIETGLGGGGLDVTADALGRLGRTLEKWQVQWTPTTDAALIERTAWGTTFEEVCDRLLGERLQRASRVDEGTGVLLEMALCQLGARFEAALDRCEQLAGDSASFPALARGAYHLDGLLDYGTARALPVERLRALARRLFARAVVHLPSAAVCGDDAVAELRERLDALDDLVRRERGTVEDASTYWRALERAADQPDSHPAVRGHALLLLQLGGRLDTGQLADRLRFWLGRATQPADGARLVAALFGGRRAGLLRNRALIASVTTFLRTLELDTLVALLPVLRASFGTLSARERDDLSETLARVLGLGAEEAQRALHISDEAREWLRAQDAALAETLEQWRTHYDLV